MRHPVRRYEVRQLYSIFQICDELLQESKWTPSTHGSLVSIILTTIFDQVAPRENINTAVASLRHATISHHIPVSRT